VFIVEVWNLSLGLISESTRSRIEWHASDGLANLIYRMWEQRHPKRDALVDVPDQGRSVARPKSCFCYSPGDWKIG